MMIQVCLRGSVGVFRFGNGILRQSVRFNSSSKQRWLARQKNDYYSNEAKLQDYRSRAAFKLMEIDDKFRIFDRSKSQNTLDLGFAPGAWSQVVRARTSPSSMILGVDILPCEPPGGVSSLQANILSRKTHEMIRMMFTKHFKLNNHDKLHDTHGYFGLEGEVEPSEMYREVFTADDVGNCIEFPVDVVISDMYEPFPQFTGFWNNITNRPYDRMANTSGLAIKDHMQSIDLCDAALVTAIDLLKPGGAFVCKLYTGKEDKLFEKRLKKVFKKCARFKPDSSRSESKETFFVGLNKRQNIDKLAVFAT